jgi:hypothetical protein
MLITVLNGNRSAASPVFAHSMRGWMKDDDENSAEI